METKESLVRDNYDGFIINEKVGRLYFEFEFLQAVCHYIQSTASYKNRLQRL